MSDVATGGQAPTSHLPHTHLPHTHLQGFEAPVHGSLGSPIILGGAPRGIAIVNGTLAAAVGLGLQQWIAGLVLWAAGHSLAVLAAKRDPDFAPVLIRHLRQKGYFRC